MFGFYAITPHLGTKETIQLQETVINTRQELRDAYLDCILFVPNGNGFFWNKFYRHSFIEEHHLRFADHRIQQDEYFNLKVYEYLERCYISPCIFYHYYIYNTGNNRSKFIANRFEIYMSIIHQFRKLQQTCGITDERFEDYLQKRLFNNINDTLCFNMFHPNCKWTDPEKQKQLEMVISNPEVNEAIDYSLSHEVNFENRIRIKAYRSKSLIKLKLVRFVFEYLRYIKNKIS